MSVNRKFLGLFRYPKSTNFFGVPVANGNFDLSVNRKYLQILSHNMNKISFYILYLENEYFSFGEGSQTQQII